MCPHKYPHAFTRVHAVVRFVGAVRLPWSLVVGSALAALFGLLIARSGVSDDDHVSAGAINFCGTFPEPPP